MAPVCEPYPDISRYANRQSHRCTTQILIGNFNQTYSKAISKTAALGISAVGNAWVRA